MGEMLFAVPFSALEYNVTKNEYVLDVSKERLEAAPGFDLNHWPSIANDKVEPRRALALYSFVVLGIAHFFRSVRAGRQVRMQSSSCFPTAYSHARKPPED